MSSSAVLLIPILTPVITTLGPIVWFFVTCLWLTLASWDLKDRVKNRRQAPASTPHTCNCGEG